MEYVTMVRDPPYCCDDYPECYHRVQFEQRQAMAKRLAGRPEKPIDLNEIGVPHLSEEYSDTTGSGEP